MPFLGLSDLFDQMYSTMGRPSIAPEKLLRALLPQVLYTVRSERMPMEQLNYNLLFRWFVGLNMDDAPVTGQSVLRTETDADTHRRFIAEFVAGLKPDGMLEIQLAQRLAQDTWRINRPMPSKKISSRWAIPNPTPTSSRLTRKSTPRWSRP